MLPESLNQHEINEKVKTLKLGRDRNRVTRSWCVPGVDSGRNHERRGNQVIAYFIAWSRRNSAQCNV